MTPLAFWLIVMCVLAIAIVWNIADIAHMQGRPVGTPELSRRIDKLRKFNVWFEKGIIGILTAVLTAVIMGEL